MAGFKIGVNERLRPRRDNPAGVALQVFSGGGQALRQGRDWE